MADKSYLVVTLRKEVATKQEAKSTLEAVKSKLADQTDVTVQGHFTNHFDLDDS